jgi:branched-subunit amino acid aminotransferase/4-amino-4-deoxychorismate lyase
MVDRVEINGVAAGPGLLLNTYGHFTAMQVRGGRVRGLDLHLQRLEGATAELFDRPLDPGRVRAYLRHALDGVGDASARVYVFWPDGEEVSTIVVTVRAPAPSPGAPQSLRSVPYVRPVAHLKHLGGFGQAYYGRFAQRNGFDDALLTGAGGVIAEAAVANIAFFDGRSVVWPDAPHLAGVTMQLIEPRLAGAGLPSRRGTVRLADLPAYGGAFVANSRGIGAVGRIDDVSLPVDEDLMKVVVDLYESVPWDEL